MSRQAINFLGSNGGKVTTLIAVEQHLALRFSRVNARLDCAARTERVIGPYKTGIATTSAITERTIQPVEGARSGRSKLTMRIQQGRIMTLWISSVRSFQDRCSASVNLNGYEYDLSSKRCFTTKKEPVLEANEQLIALTADIVSAHVANNNVAVSDVANLVQQVHAALAKLSQPTAEEAVVEKPEPFTSVRSSVKPDHIVCLVYGKKSATLKRHIQNAHGYTPAEYRVAFGLKPDYPMVAPDYSKRRSEMAHSIGLGRGGRNKAAEEAPTAKRGWKLKAEAPA